MKVIEEFLSKFKLIEDPKKNKTGVVLAINELLGIKISEDDVDIKERTITISTEPAIKSYIFTKKEVVVGEIQKKLSKEGVRLFFK